MIFFVSIFAGLLPVCIAKILEQLSNHLMLLYNHSVSLESTYMYLVKLSLLFGAQLLFLCLQDFVNDQDKIMATYSIRKKLLEIKCNVDYKYIENFNQFIKKINFASEIAGFQTLESLIIVNNLARNLVVFFSIVLSLRVWNSCLIILIIGSCLPLGYLTYQQHKNNYIQQVQCLEERSYINYYRNVCTDVKNIHALRQYNIHDFFKDKWADNALNYQNIKRGIRKKYTIINIFAEVFRNSVLAIVLLIAMKHIAGNPALGVGYFVLMYTLTRQLQISTAELVNGVADFWGTLPYMKEFFELEELKKYSTGLRQDIVKSGEILVENLCFKYYNTQRYALKNVCL